MTKDPRKSKRERNTAASVAIAPASHRYLDIGLFAERVRLILLLLLREPTKTIPLTDNLREADRFLRDAELNGRVRTEPNAPLIPPFDLLGDVLKVLKSKGEIAGDPSVEGVCKQARTTLDFLLQDPGKVKDEDIRQLERLFESLSSLAFERAPKHVDMGGYGLLTR